ncbi:DEDD exonuclease domain-containing protein [Demequina sp. TTPB684]|uniref:DEDD exonuclease domain-containing protein n=1 Tax=unclassified Demequina TaxID=2620311 RepID=UPI001CF443D5|nr:MULTISPECIES: DEDD exonuclease domain-containing protein [unclassified Demequina]MCB2413842.1 DEDD exonuclease domain-containing protein [Demequina sp. TTPB684]UPU89154.1 DEDD exonuclease domain-containing protein [Demequina sp. TMPB413]
MTIDAPNLSSQLHGVQVGLDQIGEPLHSTTFVVVDLETTGGSPASSAITEIGAVKTRGGEVIGEFQTLVDPGLPIPPMIVALTGITDAMVVAAPTIEQVLPSFLEFLGDAVLVAHNAPFDVGFLKAACRQHSYSWPGNEVVDTVTLARRATTKEEAPNKKLSTLARAFGTVVTPNHRALEDARATSEILHHMLERLARFGITHREDLDALRNPVPEKLRKKATMADKVPAQPGVYVFRGPRGEHLYVGTSKNLRSRVKTYFTRGEQRRQIREMLELAVGVDTYVCATDLEARVVEVRMIDQHRPRYNRRSVRPERTAWIGLTDERYPRLRVTRSAAGGGALVGPMRGAGESQAAIEAVQHALGVRTCTTRLTIVPRAGARACLQKDLGQCAAPCVDGESSGYDATVAAATSALTADPSPVISAIAAAIEEHASKLEFERAAHLRDGISALVDGSMRAQRLQSLRGVRLVAVKRAGHGFDVVCVVDGVLAGSAHVSKGVWAACARLKDEWDEAPADALVEEREMIAKWLESDGTRLVFIEGEWSSPAMGAARHVRWVAARNSDRESVEQLRR